MQPRATTAPEREKSMMGVCGLQIWPEIHIKRQLKLVEWNKEELKVWFRAGFKERHLVTAMMSLHHTTVEQFRAATQPKPMCLLPFLRRSEANVCVFLWQFPIEQTGLYLECPKLPCRAAEPRLREKKTLLACKTRAPSQRRKHGSRDDISHMWAWQPSKQLKWREGGA